MSELKKLLRRYDDILIEKLRQLPLDHRIAIEPLREERRKIESAIAEAVKVEEENEKLRGELKSSSNRMKTVLPVLPQDYRKDVEVQLKFIKQALKESNGKDEQSSKG